MGDEKGSFVVKVKSLNFASMIMEKHTFSYTIVWWFMVSILLSWSQSGKALILDNVTKRGFSPDKVVGRPVSFPHSENLSNLLILYHFPLFVCRNQNGDAFYTSYITYTWKGIWKNLLNLNMSSLNLPS